MGHCLRFVILCLQITSIQLYMVRYSSVDHIEKQHVEGRCKRKKKARPAAVDDDISKGLLQIK